MGRKTVEVEPLRKFINSILANSTCSPEQRQGSIMILEEVLRRSGNYGGFGYLDASQVPAGQLPGIIFNEEDIRNHEFPDETRRVYY